MNVFSLQRFQWKLCYSSHLFLANSYSKCWKNAISWASKTLVLGICLQTSLDWNSNFVNLSYRTEFHDPLRFQYNCRWISTWILTAVPLSKRVGMCFSLFLLFKYYVQSLQYKNKTPLRVFFYFSSSRFLSLFSLMSVIFRLFGVIESLVWVCCSEITVIFTIYDFQNSAMYKYMPINGKIGVGNCVGNFFFSLVNQW